MLFRIYSAVAGGHTHTRWFAGKGSCSLGKCGDLIFRNEEWIAFLEELNRRPPGGSIEIMDGRHPDESGGQKP